MTNHGSPPSGHNRPPQISRKHHYIPVFYLKQWVGPDGKLCEFSRPYKEVKPRRTHPDGTAYERNLYTVPELPPERADAIERIFMKSADDLAARALQSLRRHRLAELTTRDRAAWARFIYSLVLRTPEYLARATRLIAEKMEESVDEVKDVYEERRGPGDPKTFEEFRAKFLTSPYNMSPNRVLHHLIDSERVIQHICSMRWDTALFHDLPHSFLTSDRPVIMTNGLAVPEAHIVMPISPDQLFVATLDETSFKNIQSMPTKLLAHRVNSRVAEQARRFVYGVDDRQLRFISNRLGKKTPAYPLETD